MHSYFRTAPEKLALFGIALLLVFYSAAGWPGNQKSQQTDALDLAAIMLRDGHSDRALLALQSVNPEDEKTDRARFLPCRAWPI